MSEGLHSETKLTPGTDSTGLNASNSYSIIFTLFSNTFIKLSLLKDMRRNDLVNLISMVLNVIIKSL